VHVSEAVPEPVTGEGVLQVKPAGVDVGTAKVTTPEKPLREDTLIVARQLVLTMHGTAAGPESAKSGIGTVTVIVAF
jgi:hypothetical protein